GCDEFVWGGGDDVRAQPATGGGPVGEGAFGGQVVGQPVDLAGSVVVDVGEAETFEPARGSGTHVSKAVPAVDGSRSGGIELGGAAGGEGLERDGGGAGQVLLGVPRRNRHDPHPGVMPWSANSRCRWGRNTLCAGQPSR